MAQVNDDRVTSVLWNCPQNLTEAEKAQARENIGAGTGGGGSSGSNIVMLDITELFQDIQSDDPFPNTSVLWDTIVDTILDGNIPAFQFNFLEGITGGLALCETTFTPMEGQTKAQFKEWLRDNLAISYLRFNLNATAYGGLINFTLAFYVTPSFGFVPYYTAMDSILTGTITLEEIEVDENKWILAGNSVIVFRPVNSEDYTEGFIPAPCGDYLVIGELLAKGVNLCLEGHSLDGTLLINMPVHLPSRNVGLNAVNAIVVEGVGFANVIEHSNPDYGKDVPIIYDAGFRYDSNLEYDGVTGYYYLAKDFVTHINATETITGN